MRVFSDLQVYFFYMIINVIIFLVSKEVIGMFWGMGKISGVCRYAFL